MADPAADHPTPTRVAHRRAACASGPLGTAAPEPLVTAEPHSLNTRTRHVERRNLRPRRACRRSPVRSALFVLAMLPVLAVGLYWIATRSWFIIAAVTPTLEARVGGEVGIGAASYEGGGTFIFDDLRVRARDMQGLGAEVARIGELVIDVDMEKLIRGQVEILSARVDGLLIRTSENADRPGEYNFMQLNPEWDRSAHRSTRVPHIEITAPAIVETGVHRGGDYQIVGQSLVAGQVHRISEDGSIFSFELGEVDKHGNGLGEDGLIIHGQWNSETFEYVGRIDGLQLDEQVRRMCPRMARFYWDRMQLEGSVGSASIEYRKGEPIVAELTIQDVAMTMPVHVEGLWSIYRAGEVLDTQARPRMHVFEGVIRMVGDRLDLINLKGFLTGSEPNHATVGVPYRLSLTVPELPSLSWSERGQWLDQMLATLPFEMQLTMDDFRFDPLASETDAWLGLPTAVARMFSLFEMTGWQLSTQIDVSRGLATVNDDGTLTAAQIQSNGRAFIRQAAGRYRRFPYQLTDVEAYIEFSNDKCDVHYLNGRGAGEATVRLAGTIAPPTRHGAVELRVDATNVPLDARLRQALSGQGAEVFDSLFHEASLARLEEAGLLMTAEDVSGMRERVRELAAERAALLALAKSQAGEGDDALAALNAEIDRLNAKIESGPFALGGVVDLDLRVHRDGGQGKRAAITGQVDIQRAQILYEKFPYPITVTGGSLDWQEDAVTIRMDGEWRGLALVSAGGGRGVLVGQLNFERDESGLVQGKPKLNLTMMGDAINPVLLAAIPPDEGSSDHRAGNAVVEAPGSEGRGVEEGDVNAPVALSRSRATRLLHGLGLAGSIECTGDIVALPSGVMHYDFLVGLKHGAAVPTPDVSSVMAELGLRWPEGFSLTDVSGVVRVQPGEIGLVELTGRRGDGTVVANGSIDIAGSRGRAELNVQFKSLALEQYLVNLAPADDVGRAQELWDQFRPQGTFDAELRYRADEGQAGAAELTVQPNVLRIAASGQPVAMYHRGGSIVLHENEVRLEHLELDVQTGSREDGTLTLDGSYGTSMDEQRLSVSGAWQEGMFECPLIPEMMRLIGAKRETERYQSLMPAGAFDATFSYRSPQGDSPQTYTFELHPSSIAMVLEGIVLSATLEPSSSIVFTPGMIELKNVEGEHSGGEFNVDGQITLGAAPIVELGLAYHGDLMSQHIWAMLPGEVRSAMRDIHFHSSQAGRIRDATLTLAREEASEEWSMDFTGLIETGSCAFNVGIPFTEVDGAFRVNAHRPAGGFADVQVLATAERLRVLDRVMTNLSAEMRYSQEDEALSIDGLRGELYGGVLSAEAEVGLDSERRDYSMRIVAAGVKLDEIAQAESLGASASEVERVQSRGDLRKINMEPGANGKASGQLFASLDLAGERGREFSRSGRGTLRVVGGEVANLSLTLRVLQLMQFIPPFADTMDYADVEYYVAGDRVVFERILLEIPFMDRAALQLHGEGEMDFNTFELSTRFRSRGTIPMISDLVGGLSDRLYQIEVTGPITNPVARLLALPDFTASRHEVSNSVRQPTQSEQIVQEPVN
jgi:hypothetical protein